MAEPVSGTTQAVLAVSGVTLVGLFNWIDPEVLIGAFAGSIIFVLSTREFSIWGRWLLFIAALMAGIVAAPFAASVITLATPESITANRAVGALVSAAVSVRLLMLLATEPTSLFGRFLQGGKNGERK